MKVKDLIEALKKEDQEREVILSSDPEGNSHYLLPDNFIGHGHWDKKHCDFYGEGDLDEYSKEELREKGFVKALCIYP
jgi:hypothetical protein